MCQYVESIRVFNNSAENLKYHNARMNRTRKILWGCEDQLRIEEFLAIPQSADPTLVYKARVLYSEQFIAQELLPYTPRVVNFLKVVHTDGEYAHKAVNRSVLDELLLQKGEADNIIIIKDGFVTDTAYSNIALFDGEQWITPMTYLLPGTKRARLLDEGVVKEAVVTLDDLWSYDTLRMINAMLPFDETPQIPVRNIIL